MSKRDAGRIGRRAVHEKMSLEYRNILLCILESRNDDSDADSLHIGDYPSKWFGVTIPEEHDEKPCLNVTNRLRDLTVHLNKDQYPSLVSFVGETGQGKSTVINALIKVRFILCLKNYTNNHLQG
jgi:ABC-type multidrug transport system fused ATPase/permease subunit